MSLSFYHAEFKIPFSFFYYGSPCFLRIQAAPPRAGALLVIGMKKRDRNCARLFYLFFALPSFTAPICL